MRLLAIDPGYDRCGAAIIENNPTVVSFSTCITTDKRTTHETRLAVIYTALETLVKEWGA